MRMIFAMFTATNVPVLVYAITAREYERSPYAPETTKMMIIMMMPLLHLDPSTWFDNSEWRERTRTRRGINEKLI